ncbi:MULTISPECIES: enoyl-CoA hydratase/isomerase family protein [unclassified Bradyrhizobium]|uniref:enoyl-CoA hydratase/isomerase family protein n=1 Tax=unclassified Bradyrhizobium TaxID=2631580 RepID=UPI001FF1F7F0|nr:MULTISPECIES: enoyl-CoA hydratase/isomerase family protein [unclassified Bradyrhizobium]MCJ9728905.1 enoyl-CoA hydratase/isomerase family protein [Bradyrhizobium sp. PRIMUS42]
MATPNELVTVSREGDLVTLTMTFAPYNLVAKPLLTALLDAVEKAHKEGARAIILRSGLRHFSAGAEIELFDNRGERLPEIDVCACLDALEQVPVPIIASMHGLALGGGFELALACDIIVAADSSKAGMVEVTLGLHPLMGAIQRVASRAGVARAKEMALFGRRYDAATLERWNIVNRVVPEAQLEETTRILALELAMGPTVAHGATKRLIREYTDETVVKADRAMSDAQRPIFQSNDLVVGLKAFRESGPGHAIFSGR